MFTPDKCVKCGHSQLIPDARVICNADGADQDIKVRIDTHPDALIFKLAQRSVLRACICGKCGYTEFFINEPESLYAAYLEAVERRNRSAS